MFMIEMSTLTKMNQVLLSDELYLQTTVEEEGTGEFLSYFEIKYIIDKK